MRLLFFLFFLSTALFSKPLTKVTLQLQWKHQFEFAGFYAAKEKGYYKKFGLDVEFIEYDGTSSITQNVLDKKSDFGLTYASLIAEFLEGKPVVFLANYFKQSPLVLVTHKDIKTPDELKGKKIMGVSDNIDSITLRLMLEKFGVSLDDIKIVQTTFDLDGFIDKKVDAIAVFTTNEIYHLDKKNIQYNIFNPSVYGTEYYDLNLFTSKEYQNNNPEIVENFKKASSMGWEYALKNQEELVDIILDKYNSQNKTKNSLLFEAKQISHLMLSKTEPIGSIDLQRVKLMAKNLIESDFVTDKRLNELDKLIYTEKIKNTKIKFDKKEKEYLLKKESIKMCIDPYWEPYEKIEGGKHVGLVADFINLIQDKISTQIKLVPTTTWSQSIEYLKNGKCEILSFLNKSEDREKFLNFTPTLYEEPDVIISKTNITFLDGFNSLNNKKIGLIKDYMTDEYVMKNYPDMSVKYIKNYDEGLELVSNGDIDITVNSLLGTTYLLKKYQHLDIKIAGKTDFINYYRIGVNKQDKTLLSILSKAVDSITQKEKDNILKNWIYVKFDNNSNLALMLKILTATSIIVLFLFYRQYLLDKTNKNLKKQMEIELKKSREQEKIIYEQSKMASMGQMIGNIAHQWRQPLMEISSILMELEAKIEFEGKVTNQDIKTTIDKSNNVLKYMSNTIEDFRNFFAKSKRKEEFDLYEVISSVLKITDVSLYQNSIKVEVSSRKISKLYTYKNELVQVILNLINNAKDILVEREIKDAKIFIDVNENNSFIGIEISDNGGGIKETNINNIFEPNYSKKQMGGTGIGLFMSKIIVENNMNGIFSAENIKSGAKFSIRIPKQ